MATKYEINTKQRKLRKRFRIFVPFSYFVAIILLFTAVFRIARAQVDQSIVPVLEPAAKGLFGRVFEWIGGVWSWLVDWLQSIGIDILDILRKLGDLIVLIFESLAKLARWIFSRV